MRTVVNVIVMSNTTTTLGSHAYDGCTMRKYYM